MSEQFAEDQDVVDNDTTALGVEPSIVTDEDRLGADPLEDGMDTAEDWSRQARFGDTAGSDTLAYRIPQEEPDVTADEPPGRPIAATPALDLDESVDDASNSVDGVGGVGIEDPLAADGATEDELLTDGRGEVELGLSSALGANEVSGEAADSSIGEVAGVENEDATEGAEQQALRVEQER